MALTDSLISYWKLDESSGDATDAHGSNTLTDNNTVTSATGKIGTARSFAAASTEYLSHADNADLSTGDIDFTFGCWIYATTLPSYAGIISKGTGSADALNEYQIFYDTGSGKIGATVGNGTTSGYFTSDAFGTVSTGTWYYVIMWHDSVSNEIGISVNDSATTGSYTSGGYDNTGEFRVGALQTTYWNGRIDEVGFWKRVLTSGERTSLYNSGAGLAYPFGGDNIAIAWITG